MLFHVDPDGGDGALEWAIALTLAAGSVLLGLFASMKWRHAMPQRADWRRCIESGDDYLSERFTSDGAGNLP